MITRTPNARRLARPARIVAVLGVALAASAAGARAGVSFDVSVGLPVGDDAKVFLNVTNEYYAPPPEVATMVVKRCPRPEDDYPAVLFLARASGRAPAEILDMRLRGMAWGDVMFSLRVPPSVLFAGVARDPGPPYGAAWGSWRRHPRGRFAIADREFIEYTKLQVAAGYYHVSPGMVIAERRRGVAVEHWAAERHRERERQHLDKREDRRERGEMREERKDDRDERKEHKWKEHGNP